MSLGINNGYAKVKGETSKEIESYSNGEFTEI